jgi:hypothetical protein
MLVRFATGELEVVHARRLRILRDVDDPQPPLVVRRAPAGAAPPRRMTPASVAYVEVGIAWAVVAIRLARGRPIRARLAAHPVALETLMLLAAV